MVLEALCTFQNGFAQPVPYMKSLERPLEVILVPG